MVAESTRRHGPLRCTLALLFVVSSVVWAAPLRESPDRARGAVIQGSGDDDTLMRAPMDAPPRRARDPVGEGSGEAIEPVEGDGGPRSGSAPSGDDQEGPPGYAQRGAPSLVADEISVS